MDKIICIEKNGTTFGIGSNLDEAFKDLQNNTTYSIEIEEIDFYNAKKIKVKQQLIIIQND